MLVHVPAVLAAEQVSQFCARLAEAPWDDGRVTAGPQSRAVKRNQQLPERCAQARELGERVLAALNDAPVFLSAALPARVYPPLFNRYANGMEFGAHIDNAIRRVPGSRFCIRTDLSATLFLNPPESYDGGELVIEDTYGTQSVKLAAGDMVLLSRHQLSPGDARDMGRTAGLFLLGAEHGQGRCRARHAVRSRPSNPELLAAAMPIIRRSCG